MGCLCWYFYLVFGLFWCVSAFNRSMSVCECVGVSILNFISVFV